MTKDTLRIVYMGTPDFAVAPLRTLVESGYNVVGVVTMPDKPVGRHQATLQASPVKQYAAAQGLPVLQPERLKDPEFLTDLRALKAGLQVVVAFRMLPEVVWAMPPQGTFDLHAALLPQYRGAAPINWAVINGETQTGVTTFFLDHDIDTGRVIHRQPVPILPEDNAGSVHDKLMVAGAELVRRTIDDIIAGNVRPIPQAELSTGNVPLKAAPKIFKETCRIDWNAGLKRVHDFIRGLSPYPAAWTTLVHGNRTDTLKIYAARMDSGTPAEPSGTLAATADGVLRVALPDGYLILDTLQLAGKKRMAAADFARGFHWDGTERVE